MKDGEALVKFQEIQSCRTEYKMLGPDAALSVMKSVFGDSTRGLKEKYSLQGNYTEGEEEEMNDVRFGLNKSEGYWKIMWKTDKGVDSWKDFYGEIQIGVQESGDGIKSVVIVSNDEESKDQVVRRYTPTN